MSDGENVCSDGCFHPIQLTDYEGRTWTWYPKGNQHALLKLDSDDSPDGGYHFDTIEQAKDFLAIHY